MKETKIESFDEYLEIISKHNLRQWIYRGQNNSEYKLESSLFRTLEKNASIFYRHETTKKLKVQKGRETEMLNSVKRNAHLFLEHYPAPKADFDWLALMQHYGAPTRLLDFTFSPYIALYFALSGANREPVAVYCIDYASFEKKQEERHGENYKNLRSKVLNYEKEIDKSVLICSEPEFSNTRLLAQQGVFLIPNTLDYSHEKILKHYGDDDCCIKIIIKFECFRQMLEELSKMNITARTIYPGFEGFCKSFENIGALSVQSIRHVAAE